MMNARLIDDSAGLSIVQETTKAGGSAAFHHAHVASRVDTQAMIAAALDLGGRLDILVNNAVFTHRRKPFHEITKGEFDRVYDVNVKSIFFA